MTGHRVHRVKANNILTSAKMADRSLHLIKSLTWFLINVYTCIMKNNKLLIRAKIFLPCGRNTEKGIPISVSFAIARALLF